jgi:hypothetical protein
MKRLVRQLAQLAALSAIMALMVVATYAQNNGTVTLTGSVGSAVSLRWNSFTALGGATGANVPAAPNSPLAFTLNFNDVSPNNANGIVGGTVQLIMRSNAPYTLSAVVGGLAGFGAVGNPNGDISIADVGYGLQGLAASGSGALVVAGQPGASTITAALNNDPSTAPLNADGIPTYPSTLNNIAAATNVLTGPRISRGGSVNSPNNGLTVNTIYTIVPQFFTPVANFSATVTYTISTP